MKKMQKDSELTALRKKINELDQQLITLLNERAGIAMDIARLKKKTAEQTANEILYYRPEREAKVLQQVMAYNQGPLDKRMIHNIYREIMSACLALESPTKVAFLGPEGTFTQQAAIKHFGQSAVAIPRTLISDVFREVEADSTCYGVVPVENSTEGVVNSTLDCFLESQCLICGEIIIPIHQHLAVTSVTKIDKISKIYSHPQGIAQCRRWLDVHYPNIQCIPLSSTAEAAKRIQSEWNSAAIVSDMAIDLNNLQKAYECIEDNVNNETRFLVLGNHKIEKTGNDKTSVIIYARNKPGALYELLLPFRERKINLTRLETRPTPSLLWGYVFFIDLIGHRDDDNIISALSEIKNIAQELKILGSYPVALSTDK